MNQQHETSSQQRRKLFTPLRMGALVGAGAIVLAACGGGGGGGNSATGNMSGMAMAAQNAGNANNTAVATDAVHIKNFAFSPAVVTVKAGSTVVWTKDDSTPHDITFHGGG